MTLIEAIKSGRPFRRRSWDDGHWVSVSDDDILRFDDATDFISDVVDMCADDWEIQEPKVEITRAQFWEAVEGVLQDWEGNHMTAVTNAAKLIAAKLGIGGEP